MRSFAPRWIFIFALAVISFHQHVALAETSHAGQVAGVVVDQAGASVDGAWIVLIGAAGLETQRSVTDQNGRFTLERVLAADYIVSVQKTGFRELRRVNGRAPRERDKKDRSGCTDLNPLSPEPLAFLLPARRRPWNW